MSSSPGLAAALLAWADGNDKNVRAAVRLLVDHGHWLTCPEFTAAAIEFTEDRRLAFIDWDRAMIALRSGVAVGTASEKAILRLALALGSDVFEFDRLDHINRGLVRNAVTAALGGT
ncbi:hypothetical protein F5972_08600 [Microbispora cellulosiformans]|uniref:Uncharacterized protein n=1 Tax=Microbispora cellulosiformans TaxID=2614688 RepID=A0A5J5K6D4_9ACTN|nr:hypothetical protein [Microbispora cellulosiformans]KAA9379700.1 hypothetical protein F5972_08600 [Microbispora cellulosiformans]